MNNWVIYPEEQWRQKWELFVALLLLFVCIYTPLVLAFEPVSEEQGVTRWTQIFDAEFVVDLFFLVDIVLNFHFAYYTADYELIDDKKRIAIGYLKGWFVVDFLAIIPLDKIFKGVGSFNQLARVLRLPKLYKLIKMTRLVRMLKIVKERNKLVKYLTEILRIGVGFERLLFFLLIFLILCHIVTCIWIFTSRFQGDFSDKNFCIDHPNNWACAGGFEFDV